MTYVLIYCRQNIQYKTCDVKIQIDQEEPVNSALITSNPVEPQVYDWLYLGGIPKKFSTLFSMETLLGFVGCMRHLQLNDQDRLIHHGASRGSKVMECQVPTCNHSPCLNNGTCTRYSLRKFN